MVGPAILAGLLVFASVASAAGGPDGYLALGASNFKIRFVPGTVGAVVDWANSGVGSNTNPASCGTAPAGYTFVQLPGPGGVFNCGLKPLSTNTACFGGAACTAPLPPVLTPLALSQGLVLGKNAVFIVDPLGGDTTTCPTRGDPTVFTGQGSETNDGDLNTFTYNTGSVPTKDEISNAYAISPLPSNTASGSTHELFFGAERIANNGDTHIDFEFLQAGVTIPSPCGDGTTKFSGHRTQGDFLAAIDFTTGGALGGNTLYVWSCNGLLPPPGSPSTICDPTKTNGAAYVALPASDPRAAAFTFGVNGAPKGSSNIIGCGGWVCRDTSTEVTSPDQVATNDFMEGGVNLDTLGFTGCVNTFIPHTRSSQSFTSVLKDFGGPGRFNTCSIVTTPSVGSGGSVEIKKPVTDTAVVNGFSGTSGTVNFQVFGPFSGPANVSCSGTPAQTFLNVGPIGQSAPATFTSPAFTPQTPGLYQWVATYPAGPAFTACPDPTEQFRAVDANINITPLTATNAVRTGHVFTATVKINAGNGAGYVNAPDGTSVGWTLSNNTAGATISTANPCVTSGGSCSITVTSTSPGLVTINASTAVVVNGVTLNRATADGLAGDGPNAVKTFVDANINISPPSAVNEVRHGHLFTATVKINTGSGGYVNAPDGTQVTFSLSNNTAGATLSGANPCSTSGGSCSITVTSNNTGQVTITASTSVTVGGVVLNRSTGDGLAGDGPSGVKTFVDANLSLSPPTASNEIKHNHVITATVKTDDGSGSGLQLTSGVTVNFTLTDTNGASSSFVGPSSCTTDASGTCTVTITSPTSGNTGIHASYTTTVKGVTLTRATGDGLSGDGSDVTKNWVDANLKLSPPAASNEINKNHIITATVNTDNGNGTGLQPASGVTVNFTLNNTNGATSAFVGPSSCTTGASGTCTVTISSPTSGNTSIHASYTTTVNGVSISRATGDGLSGDGNDVTKNWVDANLKLSPPAASNEINKNHIITATVNTDNGSGSGLQPASGVTVNFTLNNTNGATSAFVGPSSCTTDGSGTCTVTISSPTSGNTSIHASYTTTVNGVTISRATGDGLSGDSSDATKNWVDANLSLSPLAASNEINHNHVITATVKTDDGSGSGLLPAGGVTVNFTLSNSNGATSAFVGPSSCTTDGSGTCTVTITSPTAGNTTIHASYTTTVNGVTLIRATGDGLSGDSGDANKTFVDANISITPQNATNPVGTTHTLTATVMTNDGTGFQLAADGTSITFSIVSGNAFFTTPATCSTSGGTGSCQATISSNIVGTNVIQATTTVTITPSNLISVTLTRTTGDTNVGDSPNAIKKFTPLSPTITTTPDPSAVTLGTSTVTLKDTATLSGGFNPTGSITFTLTSPSSVVVDTETVSVNGNGNYTTPVGYTLPTSGSVVGTYEWTASYSGDVNNNSASSNFGDEPVVISPANPAISTTTNPPSVTLGTTAPTLKDSATLSGGYFPTGSITFTLYNPGNVVVDTETVSVSGNGTYTTPTGFTLPTSGTVTGTYQWTASYSGDANNNPASTSKGDEPVTVSPASPTIVTTPGGTIVIGSGSKLTDSATLSGGYFPTGTITFTLYSPGNLVVDTETVPVSGNGTYTTPTGFVPTATGTYQWVAAYSGDGNNNPATSNKGDEPEVVQPASPTIKTTPGGTVVVGSGAKLTDSATLSGGFNPTGTITFTLYDPSNAVVDTETVTVNGNGTYSTPTGFVPTVTGTYQWVAVYSGDSNNKSATSNKGDEPEVVQPASPTLATLATSPSGIQINTTVTISDAATLGGAFNPTGLMSFTLVGPNSCSTVAIATFTRPVSGATTNTGPISFSPTVAGAYYWIASYSGDINNNPAGPVGCNDPNEKVTVLAPTAQITPTGTTCQQFSSGTASTLTNFFYSGTTTIGQGVNPGVFFYYEKVTIGAGATITVNETLTSGQGANYLLGVLNNDPSQVQVFDANCNSISGATIKLGSGGLVTITGLPAGSYIFSVKYTPKSIAGQPIPSPTTLIYSFFTQVNGVTVSGSTQGISGIKQ